MDYSEIITWLFDQETMGIKFGLENVTELLNQMGCPHTQFRSVHVAGTNGKGSVSAITASVLREAGYRTGLYTSPHLVDFRERIQVDGVMISEKEMLRLAEELKERAERMRATSESKRLTFFELTTAMAFAHFADRGVEEAVVEVGMGGRLDATNVIVPECSVITKISLEHTMYLGDNIAAIAGEKAGIIKRGVPVVTVDQSPEAMKVFETRAGQLSSPLKVLGKDVGYELVSSTLDGTRVFLEELDREVTVPLLGSYQAANLAVSCGCLTELMKRGVYIPDEAMVNGFAKARWPGRLEVVSRDPMVIFDVTHTPDGARIVSEEVARLVGNKVILVLGVLDDKDLESIARSFGSLAKMSIATSPRNRRAYPAAEVEASLLKYCPRVERRDEVAEAMKRALQLATAKDTVVVTGSLYTLGEAMRWWDERKTG